MIKLIRRMTLVAGFVLAPGLVSAQTTTAFKTGEQTTGMTKQCYYEALGNRYTQTLRSVELCPLSIRVATSPKPQPQSTPSTSPPPAPATITAFKTGEKTTGMTKQCFYDGLGNEYTKTVRSIDLCPLTIKVVR